MTSFAMNDLGFDAGAMERCWETWERQGRDWHSFDRIYMTEPQAVSLIEKMTDTSYFSSETLMRPSIPEFTAIMQEPDRKENTYVCFRRTAMKEEDFLETTSEELSRTITPVIDAYVYINNGGAFCNMVITIARTVLVTDDGKMITSTSQFMTYVHEDPMTAWVLSQGQQYFQEFIRTVKCIYFAIQMLSLERPEVMAAETVREEYKGTVKKKGRYKAVRKTRFIKVIRVSDDAIRAPLGGHHTMTCPCWGVAGHWRTYKSGKQVWIKPYRKGKERKNPASYKPKEYEFPKEDN